MKMFADASIIFVGGMYSWICDCGGFGYVKSYVYIGWVRESTFLTWSNVYCWVTLCGPDPFCPALQYNFNVPAVGR